LKKRIKDLAFTLKIPKSTLLELCSVLDQDESKLYHNWNVPKKDHRGNPRVQNGKTLTRPINAPTKKLKFVQSRLLNQVLYQFPLPEYFFGGVKKKDAVMNARHHQGNKYFFLTDLKDFYPSIKSTSIEASLRQLGFYPDVAKVITRLCTKKGEVPQGCPTSSFIASLVVLHSIDDLMEIYKKDGLKVSVYVDDLTFSSQSGFKDKTQDILQHLRSRGLKINFSKTHYCTYNPVVTGVLAKNNGISPLPHTFQRAEDTTLSIESRLGHLQRIEYIKKLSKKSP